MSFQNPAAFLLLLLIPLYWILRKAGLLKKPSVTAVLSDWQGNLFEWKDGLTRFFYILSKTALYAGFVLAVIALSDPVHKYQEKIYTSRGTDILFVLDTSPSMVAKDVNGKTRLQASKDAIETLFSSNKGTRCGIVTLGSEAAVIIPPTNDYDTFCSRLRDIQAGSMGDGSAIGTGLSTAVYHLLSSAAPKRCIILFTDGENNAGDIHPETAAELAARNDITLYVFGVGSKGTVSIDYTDPVSGKNYSGYLNSDFDSTSLRRITSIGNGKYFETSTIGQLNTALEAITQNETLAQDFIYKTVTSSYYKQILVAVLFCFVIGWIITRIFMRYKKFIISRSVGFFLAFVFILISLSDLSWGTSMVPVHKSSNAVSFVFDISNSMNAKDETGGMTRLQAATVFSQKLLSKIPGTPVSVVLCKGDGKLAIPLSEDFVMIDSLLSSLSPNLMSAPGTSLGKGILAAKNSFPENISAARHIWVFTDGEDNDTHLQNALSECMKKGISVKIVGFGTEKGADILAGDKKTTVHSSLKSDFILLAIENVAKKMPAGNHFPKPEFLIADNKGSGSTLLHSIEKNKTTDSYLTYEEKPVSRFKLFLGMAFFFFISAILISELNLKKPSLLLAASLVLLSGCSGGVKGKVSDKTFKGLSYYKQQELEKATGEFLECLESSEQKVSNFSVEFEMNRLRDYALYNLSATYLMANEKEAAMEKLSMISPEASEDILFNTAFNAGVICYRSGDRDKAAEYFKKALEINSTSVEAKINLELSQKQNEILANENEAAMRPSGEDKSGDFDNLEKTVFERIKENDKKQWKNSETTKTSDLSEDY